MKKKLIAWMMSATMALGSMTLPVYAENEEVAVEFSDETDEETEEPETEVLDIPEELQTDTGQDFADAGSEDFSDHMVEELFSSGDEAVGESRTVGGNINWGSSGSLLPTDVTTARDGCVLVGVKGSYITDVQAVLARVNEIRKEACEEGVPDPRNEKRKLTPSDYVPIRWSSDLEYIARIRAAEASLVIAHTRPNGTSCFTLKSPNGIQSYGEVLAWNYTQKFLPGIEQWYEEKADWVNQNSSAVTGHYTQMIDPDNIYAGYATFINPDAKYPTTTSGEYSSYADMDETSGPDISNCTQTIEAEIANLTAGMSDFADLKEENSVQADFYVQLSDSGCKLSFLDKAEWKSSNPSVASVDGNGQVKGLKKGTADITASKGSLTATRTVRVIHDHSWDAGKVTKLATCTKDGEKIYTCNGCGETKTEVIKATGHKETEIRNATESTCQKEGYTGDKVCKACGEVLEKGKPIAKKDHSWDAGKVTKSATCTKDGEKIYTCSGCGETKTEVIKATGHKMGAWKTVASATTQKEGRQERSCTICNYKETRSIPKLKSYNFKVVSSKSAVTYNGKAQKPAVTVYAGNKKISSKYYTVSYKNNTAVGTAMITIQGKGNYKKYSGKTTFRINLQKTTLSSTKSSRKGQLQVTWKKTAGNAGYQIQYATNAKFSGAKTKNTKATRYTFKGLKSKRKYYVRVRTYKKVGSNYWYSKWSNVRNVKIK